MTAPADSNRPPREPTELRVEPTAVTRSRRRTGVPAAVVAVAAIAFVGAAVWKPWDTNANVSPGRSTAPRASIAAAEASPEDQSPPSDGPLPTPIASFPSNAAILASTTSIARWGLRSVVLPPAAVGSTGSQAFVERWLGIDVASGAAWTLTEGGAIGGPLDDVLALGVTTPDDAMPLDVRFWRLDRAVVPERIVPIPIPGREPGSWLWLPDPREATVLGTWAAGTYRMDVLLGPRIVRLVATIPYGSTGPATPAPSDLLLPPEPSLAGIEPGPFAIVAGRTVTIAGGGGPLVDERLAWLGAAGGLALSDIAQVVSPDVTGLGVLLPAGAGQGGIGMAIVPAQSGGLATIREALADRNALLLRPADGGAFPSGLYRVSADWTAGGVRRSSTTQLEIVPATPPVPPSSPLDRLARWVGRLDSAHNRAGEPLVFLDPRATAGRDTCAAPTRITSDDVLIGLGVPAGVEVRGVALLSLDGRGGRDIPVRVALSAIPRLTVMAVARPGLPVGDDQLVVELVGPAGEARITQRICVRAP